jgi:hypothetical protein
MLMSNFQRMFFIIITLLAAMLLLPVSAQDDPIPFELGETIEGTLEGGEGVYYSFDLPVTQDVVVRYDATGLVLSGYEVTTRTPDGVSVEIEPGGGGGGDVPVNIFFIIPAYRLPDADGTIDETEIDSISRSVVLRLGYPAVDGAADYILDIFAVEPVRLNEENTPILIEPEPNEDGRFPEQVFVFPGPMFLPFSVQIEELGEEGAFLWVASEPPRWARFGEVMPADNPLLKADFIDAARMNDYEDIEEGIQTLTLYQAGDETFRAVVQANTRYVLRYNIVPAVALYPGVQETVTLSYRDPLAFFILRDEEAESITVNARLFNGEGARVRMYENRLSGAENAILGRVTQPNTVYPRENSITREVTQIGSMEIFVQIPEVYHRGEVTVELEWINASNAH